MPVFSKALYLAHFYFYFVFALLLRVKKDTISSYAVASDKLSRCLDDKIVNWLNPNKFTFKYK